MLLPLPPPLSLPTNHPPTHRQHHTWAAAAQNKEKLKIGIVGAGLAGMIAAMDLADAGHDVEIFESRKFVGGKVARDREEYGIPGTNIGHRP